MCTLPSQQGALIDLTGVMQKLSTPLLTAIRNGSANSKPIQVDLNLIWDEFNEQGIRLYDENYRALGEAMKGLIGLLGWDAEVRMNIDDFWLEVTKRKGR